MQAKGSFSTSKATDKRIAKRQKSASFSRRKSNLSKKPNEKYDKGDNFQQKVRPFYSQKLYIEGDF